MGEGCKGMSQRTLEAILDASALYPLLRRLGEKAASLLTKLAILDLTRYELGNILWKEYKLGLLKDWENTIVLWSKIMEEMPTYRIETEHLRDVEKIAVERDLTFYDASYVYMAETKNLKLITEDEELLNKCKNSLPLNEFLKSLSPTEK